MTCVPAHQLYGVEFASGCLIFLLAPLPTLSTNQTSTQAALGLGNSLGGKQISALKVPEDLEMLARWWGHPLRVGG